MAIRRGVVFVLVLIGLAIVASVAVVALMFAVASRGPAVPSSATLVLRPGGDIQETSPNDVVGQLIGRDTATVRSFVDSLAKAKREYAMWDDVIQKAKIQTN